MNFDSKDLLLLDNIEYVSYLIEKVIYDDFNLDRINNDDIKNIDKINTTFNEIVLSEYIVKFKNDSSYHEILKFLFNKVVEKKIQVHILFINYVLHNSNLIVGKDKIYFAEIDLWQAKSTSIDTRKNLEEFRYKVLKSILISEYIILKKENKLCKKYLDTNLFSFISGCNMHYMDTLKYSIISYLKITDETYRILFFKFSKLIDSDKCSKADINFILKGGEWENNFFSSVKLKKSLGILKELFVNRNLQKYINIDIKERAKKNSRAFCSKILFPSNIKAVINPVGGYQDWKDSFHEVGHALTYINLVNSPKGILRVRSSLLDETIAIFFENLINDTEWYNFCFGKRYTNKILEYIHFCNLLSNRRQAGMVLYELELYTQKKWSLKNCKTLYTTIMEQVFLVPISGYCCLHFIDHKSYTYLFATSLANQLYAYFRRVFGQRWFLNTEAIYEIQNILKLNTVNDLFKLLKTETIDFSYLF